MLTWLVYICFGAGLLLVIYSLVGFRASEEQGEKGFNMERALEAMDRSINDADNTATELVKISQGVVDEIDDKYQQLLYLYSLIEEKSEKLDNNTTAGKRKAAQNTAGIDISIGESFNFRENQKKTVEKAHKKGFDPNLVNSKYRDVFELHNEGMTTAEIARSLNIGQGEVQLVLELGKGR